MEEGDLRRGVEADWSAGGPKAAIDVKVAISEAIQALRVRAEEVGGTQVEPEQTDLDLPAVVMSGQREGDVTGGSLWKDLRTMRQKDCRKRRVQAL